MPIVTLAETMKSDMVARGVPAERIYIVPNGVDPEAFQPRPPDPELRARYGLGERYVIGYVSNLDHPREGQETLIEATALLAKAGRDVACLIVGEGRRRAEVEAVAAASGAADRIVFTGAVPHDEVPAMYALLDAFVVPRRDERAARLVTPLKPFEAMAMARPLIVADLPALTEVAPDGERSLAYRPEDAMALAAAVVRLMDHPDLGRPAGEAGGNGSRASGPGRPTARAGPRSTSRCWPGDADRRPQPGRRRLVNLVPRGIATDARERGAGGDGRAPDARGGRRQRAGRMGRPRHGQVRCDRGLGPRHRAGPRGRPRQPRRPRWGSSDAVGARVVSAATDLGQRRGAAWRWRAGWRRGTSSDCGRTRRSRSCWAQTGIRRRSRSGSTAFDQELGGGARTCRAGSCWPR